MARGVGVECDGRIGEIGGLADWPYVPSALELLGRCSTGLQKGAKCYFDSSVNQT